MGSVSQMLKDLDGSKEDEQDKKERLEFLLAASKAKIRAYKDEINEMFLNPDAAQRTQIPGIRSIRFIEQYHVSSSQGLNEKINDHIQKAVSAFFSISGDDKDKEKIQNGVSSLISTALDGFIGSTSVGESEERVYVVVPENNAFVRADIACWKYTFSQHKFIDQNDTALAYVLCKSVVDHTKLSVDELIYFVTDALSQKTEVAQAELPMRDYVTETSVTGDAYFDPVMRIVSGVSEVKAVVDAQANKGGAGDKPVITAALWDLPAVKAERRNLPLGSRLDFAYDGAAKVWKPKLVGPDYSKAVIDSNRTVSSKPASIGDVQAYIEELIAVWKKLRDDQRQV